MFAKIHPNRKSVLTHLTATGLLFLIPLLTTAQCDPSGGTFCSPVEGDLYTFLYNILNAVVYIIFPFIVLMIVYTGFLFVQAQGNSEKLSKARSSLVWTVIGALVVLGAKALAMAIEATVQDITV